ncbi:MAG: amino acid permease [Candidatus Micrarchaeota archaeon]
MTHYQKHYSQKPRLKRELGLWSTTLIGVGIILGAGIYALIGEGVAIAGVNIWISFVIGAIVAAITGLSYAELSSMLPKAGAEFDYVKTAFSERLGFLAGWMVICAGIISIATVALGFGGYFERLTGISAFFAAIGLTVLSALIVLRGIRESANIGTFFTIVETAGLLIIIFLGFPLIGSIPLYDAAIPAANVLGAAALIFFAFIGFEDIVRLSEETKNPTKTIPKALILAIIISSVLYVLVAIAAISIVNPNQLAVSSAPLADVASTALGPAGFWVLSLIALFATGNTVLLFLLVVSRIVYGMARDNNLPEPLAGINPKTHSPALAIIVCALISLLFLFVGDISFVANATAFLLFAAFVLVNASVIQLRQKHPGFVRPFRVPISIGKIPVLPVIGILVSVTLMVSMPLPVIATGIGLTAIGGAYHFSQKKRPILLLPAE